MPVRLFVGNLPYSANQAELKEFFSTVGPVSYISLPTLRETGQPRGFAFVEFIQRTHAEEAIRQFNNRPFKGRTITVSEARAREDRPAGSMSVRQASPPQSMPPAGLNAEPDVVNRSAPVGKRARDFGPDAPPQSRRNKAKGGSRQEYGSKGPMREVVKGQFSGEYEDSDDLYDEPDEVVESDDDDPSVSRTDIDRETNNNQGGIGGFKVP
jgi:cold-inducible RNA-binding protein